jgi:general stress protein 26
MPDNQIDKIHELLEDFDTAMLVTHANNSFLHSRPMAIAKVEPNCDLWFFTGRDSSKVNEIQDEQRVLIVCQDEHSRYISLLGQAELVSDRALFADLWQEHYKTWFPAGIDDPNLLLICVHAREAEYWDNQGTKGVKYMFQSLKAYATGTTPHAKEGEQHAKVALK